MAPKESSRLDLNEILIKEGILSLDQLNNFLAEQEKSRLPLLEVLIRSGKIDEKKLLSVFTRHFSYTAINPSVFIIDPELMKLIPKKLSEKFLALPISTYEKTLTIAFANPMNVQAIDEIMAVTGMRIKAVAAEAGLLKKMIHKYYGEGASADVSVAKTLQDSEKGLDELVKMIETEQGKDTDEQAAELLKIAYETPVIKLVNMILLEGVRRHASDIFIEPWENHVRVRVRVDGLLEEVIRAQKTAAAAIVSRIKVMSDLDISEHRIPQDGRLKIKINSREVDMRISMLPTCFGEKVCLRILDTTVQSHDISKLGFVEEEQLVIKNSAQKPHGMILVTGPTGSGKTTTLYSVLKYLDNPEVNITTVEDPVEYQLPGINQVNVRETIGLTFPGALRSILRQDPDIILIGEIRDNTTLDIAVKAALTGHLVLSTLHTNDAASSITRMRNMGLESFLIASTVLMISAQRLVRRLCPKCRAPIEMDKAVLAELGINIKGPMPIFYTARGCAQCRQSGYKGRTVITEILQITPAMRAKIMHGASAEAIKVFAHEQGMSTLRESAIRKAIAGETSLEEVFRVTSEDQGQKKMISDEPETAKGREEAA